MSTKVDIMEETSAKDNGVSPMKQNGNEKQEKHAKHDPTETHPEDSMPAMTTDLSVLAEAAAKSPKRPVSREISLDLSPMTVLPGNNVLTAMNGIYSPLTAPDNDKKVAAAAAAAASKSAATGAANKAATTALAGSKRSASPPQKREASKRARKLPSKLRTSPVKTSSTKKKTPSTADVAAMLVQVASGAGSNDESVAASPASAASAKRKKRKYKRKETTSKPPIEADIRGITMKRPGKWQAQFYYSGQSRYIGIFTSQQQAAHAYEIVRKALKGGHPPPSDDAKTAFAIARKAAFDGVEQEFGLESGEESDE